MFRITSRNKAGEVFSIRVYAAHWDQAIDAFRERHPGLPVLSAEPCEAEITDPGEMEAPPEHYEAPRAVAGTADEFLMPTAKLIRRRQAWIGPDA